MEENGLLGVCVVGCGDMGTRHAACWDNVAEARVVAVVDVREDRAEKLARAHGLDTWHTDYRAAVPLEDVDVVSVCVPTCLHPEVAIFSADHSRHVLSEKPIALTLEQADGMIEAAERNGVKLGVGFMRRHSPVLHALRDWLAAGNLGRPVMYHAADVRQVRPKREMHDVKANGGPVIDMGVHVFDLWRFIFDSEPVEVFAQGLEMASERRELDHIEQVAYDTASVLVRYASRDMGTFFVSWGLPPGVNPTSAPDQILGPKGYVQVTYGTADQSAQVMVEGGEWEPVAASEQNMYEREIASFARAILEDEPFLASGEDGKAALRVALAALESIDTGQAVSLP
jgi:predicted dehydrogenase